MTSDKYYLEPVPIDSTEDLAPHVPPEMPPPGLALDQLPSDLRERMFLIVRSVIGKDDKQIVSSL